MLVLLTAWLPIACDANDRGPRAASAGQQVAEPNPEVQSAASVAGRAARVAQRGPTAPEVRVQPRPIGVAARVLAWRSQVEPSQHVIVDEVVDAAMRGDVKELRQIVQREDEKSSRNRHYPTFRDVFRKRDSEGWSALHHVAFRGDMKSLRVLMNTGALNADAPSSSNPDELSNRKPATSHDRCVSALHLAAMEGKLDALQLLAPLKKEIAPQATPREIDSSTHNPFALERLADLQPETGQPRAYTQDIDGLTAFQYAVIFERIDAMEHLGRFAIETNAGPESSFVPHSSAGVAVDACKIKSLEWLAAHQFPFDEIDMQGHKLLHRAVLTQDPKVLAWLIDKADFDVGLPTVGPRRPTAMHLAAEHGAVAVLAFLLERGCLVDEWDANQGTPLQYAAAVGQLDAVGYLLSRGARLDARAIDGSTPLIAACGGGHAETVRALLELGASASDLDSMGSSALMYAAGRGRLAVVNLLLEAGADFSARNTMGWTALHVSATSGHADVVERLIEAGAAVDALDGSGATPLDCAAHSANGQAASRVLRRHGARVGREIR